MKTKIISLILVSVFAAALLMGCASSDVAAETAWVDVNSGNVRKSTHSETQAETAPDTDENGNLLLTTDDNRLVYQTDYGCEVIVFNGSYVNKMYLVYTFATADDAGQYLSSHAKDIMSAGDITDIKQQDSILILSPKMTSENYIKYLSMTREQVEEEFASFQKQ